MSRYATHLAHARLQALRTLITALNQAEDPAEKRRCAVAILSAPDPCDLDDAIELGRERGNEAEAAHQHQENTRASLSTHAPSPQPRPVATPSSETATTPPAHYNRATARHIIPGRSTFHEPRCQTAIDQPLRGAATVPP